MISSSSPLSILPPPCESVSAADGAFAADQRQLVLVNAKGVRAVTDRLILIVDGDLVFLDFVCKFIGDIGQEQGSVSITAELIGRCAIQVPFAFKDISAARTALTISTIIRISTARIAIPTAP